MILRLLFFLISDFYVYSSFFFWPNATRKMNRLQRIIDSGQLLALLFIHWGLRCTFNNSSNKETNEIAKYINKIAILPRKWVTKKQQPKRERKRNNKTKQRKNVVQMGACWSHFPFYSFIRSSKNFAKLFKNNTQKSRLENKTTTSTKHREPKSDFFSILKRLRSMKAIFNESETPTHKCDKEKQSKYKSK